MTCLAPTATANSANCNHAAGGDLTPRGSYTGSASPYGTYDQGGNVWEWNEAIIGDDPPYRGSRGGAFYNYADAIGKFPRGYNVPTGEFISLGFRVASIPEPGTGLLVMLGMLGLSCWRRPNA